MKYIKIVYNSFLWAMAVSATCFGNTWLQMRVNTGYIFFGGWLAFILLLCVIFHKRRCMLNTVFTAVNLIVCAAYVYFLYGVKRLQVIPASIIREGIHRTDFKFSAINKWILAFLAAGILCIAVSDFIKRKKETS